MLHVNSRCPETNLPFGPIAVYHAFAAKATDLVGPSDEFVPKWAPLGGSTLTDMLPDYNLWLPATYGFSQANRDGAKYFEFDLRDLDNWSMALNNLQDAPEEFLAAA